MRLVGYAALALVWAGLLSCSASSARRADPSRPVASGANSTSPAASAEPEELPLSLVSASVVVDACPDAKQMNHQAAKRAIHRLVDPCAGVPGGKAHFSATLQPGGRIELGSPGGDPEEGVVPTCVLRHNLRHQVFLRNACRFDVLLEERPEVTN